MMLSIGLLVSVCLVLGCKQVAGDGASSNVTVVAYYFGNFHPGDPRNTKLKGANWSEWDLLKNARPRFPGHVQPKVPLWGYLDESQPEVMETKITAAADHNVDVFLFDYYHYNDGPFLNATIDRGFLGAKNSEKIKFALMWANHDWVDIQPFHRGSAAKLLFPGKVTPESFEKITDHIINDYFTRNNYWKIEDKPYLSFYDLSNLLSNFNGSVSATRQALDKVRQRAVTRGLKGVHLNAVVWGQTILPGENTPTDQAKLVHDLGFDSVTSYVWIHYVALPSMETQYDWVRDRYFEHFRQDCNRYGVPYIPNVSMGWDPSPRADQTQPYGNFGYPFTNTIVNNTPTHFEVALHLAKEQLNSQSCARLPIVNINAWNEWTEGSYLEPDTVNKMGYLQAIRNVFG